VTGTARPRPAGAARTARISFLLAGISGLLIVAPMYVLEERVGRDYPPAITHPELYYGFIGVAIAWQVAFLFIGGNPVRFRPLMIAAMIEKYSYGIAVALLYHANRVPTVTLAFGIMDLAWGVVFLICYLRLSGA
jgi:hypothetical protein